jgi:hypothetical protein
MALGCREEMIAARQRDVASQRCSSRFGSKARRTAGIDEDVERYDGVGEGKAVPRRGIVDT